MIKQLTSSIIFFFCVVGVLGAEERTVLTVSLIDNTKVQFYLSEQPIMTLKADSAIFVSTTSRISYLRSQIDRFYFDKLSGITVNKANADVSSQIFSDYILLSSESSLPIPSVYNIMGMKFPVVVSRISENEVQISIASLPKGIYIVNVKKQSFRFLKK